jgi:hypothetical protein
MSFAVGCAANVERDAAFEPTDPVSWSEQALSADPGPKNAYVGAYLAHFGGTRSDGTYAYVRYRTDQDRYCFGRVLRVPVGGGEVTSARAPCFTQDFAVGQGGVVYFAAVTSSLSGPAGGVYRATFDGAPWMALTTADARAIASDASYIYWDDGAALHRMLPDGSGDMILAADAAATPSNLLVDGSSVYGYDGGVLWRLPKNGGAKLALATLGFIDGLQLDHKELFWIEGSTRIQRLSIMGGTPATVHESSGGGVRGLGVAGKWVYWSNGTDLLRRAKSGGSIATIDTDEYQARVLATDTTNVYYASTAVVGPPFPLFRRLPTADLVAPVCDETPRQLASGVPSGLAVAGTWIYYTEGDTVRRVWKNGGSVETRADNQPEARSLHAGPAGLAWVTLEGVNSLQWGARLPGPSARYAANARDVVGDAADPTDPLGAAGRLYYNDGSRIVGLNDTTLATGITPYRLAGDEDWIYWTDRGDQTLSRVPRAGGNVEELVRLSSGELGHLTLGANAVFFTVNEVVQTGVLPSMVMRVPKSGGAATVVAQSVMAPYDLEVAGRYLYFSSVSPAPQTVYRVEKRGGTPTALATGDSVWLLDVLGSCVVYTTQAGINTVSKL